MRKHMMKIDDNACTKSTQQQQEATTQQECCAITAEKIKTEQQYFLPVTREIRGMIAMKNNNRNNEKSTAEGISALVWNDVVMQCELMKKWKFRIPCAYFMEHGI